MPSKIRARFPIDLAVYSAVTLLVIGPLLKPGYVLTLDMVFTPQLRMPDVVSSSYILKVLLHTLDLALPADVVQKLLLATILLLAGCGMHRLAQHMAGCLKLKLADNLPLYFAGLLYMVNPYTYDRLMAGQYNVLLGYALLPWFGRALYRLVESPAWRTALVVAAWAVAISIASIHSIGLALIVATLVIARQLWQLRGQRAAQWRLARFAGVVLAVGLLASSYWLLPELAGSGPQARIIQSITSGDRLAFATAGNGPLERIGNVLGLQGFWAERYGLFVLPQQAVAQWLWLLLTLVVLALVAVGAVAVWRRNRGDSVVFASCIVIATLLAAGIGGNWLAAHVPFFRGYREPQKFAGLVVLSYGVLASVGFAAVVQRLRDKPRRRHQVIAGLAAGLLLAVPALLTPTMWWGANGQLQAGKYPAGWYAINRQLNADVGNFQTLFLPWHLYMYVEFAGRTIANPAPLFFDKPVIISDDAELQGAALNKSRPVTRQVASLLDRMPAERNADTFSKQLAAMHIKYVIFVKDSDYKRYEYIAKQHNLTPVTNYPEITLYRNDSYRP